MDPARAGVAAGGEEQVEGVEHDRDLGPGAGDHDRDGIGDVAVGAFGTDDGGADRGAVWVVFLDGAFCGDGTKDSGEDCDDGNTASFDGCSATCRLEGQAIPTLPLWTLLILVALLLGTSGWLMRRRLGEKG